MNPKDFRTRLDMNALAEFELTWILFLFFFALPIMEIWILSELSDVMTLGSIIALCVLTGAYGVWLDVDVSG